GDEDIARGCPVEREPAAGQRDADRVADADLVVQRDRPATPRRLALDGDDVARRLDRIIAERVGPDELAGQMQVDMRAGQEWRQFPAVGVDQGEDLDAVAAVVDGVYDGLDRRDRSFAHSAFRTISPTLTTPPRMILQFSPERLMRGSKIALPVISSICRHGID